LFAAGRLAHDTQAQSHRTVALDPADHRRGFDTQAHDAAPNRPAADGAAVRATSGTVAIPHPSATHPATASQRVVASVLIRLLV
ncbi:MAG: hypothetical protein JO075_05130, partial [Acidimicrobiia bacterium]|nr:hypothetical protein [Acidimicrobiia bacterium]